MPPIQLAPLRLAAASFSRRLATSSHTFTTPIASRSSPFLLSSRSKSTISNAPASTDRGPKSNENTQTDFRDLDVLGGTAMPSTAIDACLWDGFHLNNGVKITNGAGVLLVAGEAFAWKPWNAARITTGGKSETGQSMGTKRLANDRGVFEVGPEAWGVLGLVWPKPGEWYPRTPLGFSVVPKLRKANMSRRSSHSGRRAKHDASQPSNKTSHQQSRNPGRDSGYQKRSCAIQLAGNRARCWECCGGIDTIGVEGRNWSCID